MTTLKISITHGGTYTPEGLTLYVSPDLYNDVIAELEAKGIEAHPIHQFSHDAVTAAIVLYGFLQANGLGQLAQIIEAISHRNDGKSIRVKIGDDEFEAAGDTYERMATQLSKLQEQNAKEQDTLRRLGMTGDDDVREEDEPGDDADRP